MRCLTLQKAYPIWVCLFGFFGFSCPEADAQRQAEKWCFSEGLGIDFSGDSIKLFSSNLIGFSEANASICDRHGQLVLYTDGVHLWNGKHELIDTLRGHTSAKRGVLFIPYPAQKHLYYLINTPELESQPNELVYSLIDINANNGKGAIIEKEISLGTDFMECQAATHHRNGKDVWLVVHKRNSDAFWSYLISDDGIDIIPKVSEIGYRTDNRAANVIKISPLGKKLALIYQEIKKVGIFRFDNIKGIVTDPIYFDSDSIEFSNHLSTYRNIAFSPLGDFLYVQGFRRRRDKPTFFQVEIDQQQHRIKDYIAFEPWAELGLELAIDGKIYGRDFDGIHIIHHPDRKGALCELEELAIQTDQLKTNYLLGLPNFISSYFRPCQIDLGPRDTLLCEGESLVLDAQHDFGREWVWSDGSSEPILSVSQPGTYCVEVTGRNCDVRDTITVRYVDCSLEVPNVFTPNGDGINDRFEIPGVTNTPWQLRVFNRWGREVFRSDRYQNEWDGTGLPAAAFYYHLRSPRLHREYKGWVVVKR